MKKVLAGVAVATLVAALGAGSAFAGHHSGWRNAAGTAAVGAGYYCVDANGDGVCDYYGTHSGCGTGMGYGYVDANGDGVCDYYGTHSGCGTGMGYGYVDANGDGVCDYYGTGVGGSHHGGCAR